MTLNHINLTVIDPIETSAFLARCFGLRSGGGNAGMQVVFDDRGMVITLMKSRADDRAPGETDGRHAPAVRYPGSFHIGFFVESRERVAQIHQQVRDEGYAADAPGPSHGSWGFYFQAPGGVTIEVAAA